MKAKPVLLVIITLIIGFVLGMLVSAQVRFHKLKPVRMYFSEERFREGFFNAIQPDEKQKAEIVVILDKYAKLNGNLQTEMRRELDSNIKEMRKELDSKLTKDQLGRLKVMDEQRQKMIRQNRKNRSDSIDHHNRPGGPQDHPSQDGRLPQDHPSQDGRLMPPPDRPSFHPGDTAMINR